MGMWESAHLEIWSSGNLELWETGKLEMWDPDKAKHDNSQIQNPGHPKCQQGLD